VDMRAREPVTQWVEVDGARSARLATESLGEGQPFVWGHGLLGSMEQDLDGGVMAWRELGAIAQVIRFDARGHGQSETQGDPEDFRWDNLARSMWQVVDNYTTEPAVLGGASMGCATSLYAACQRPEQVKGLVLVLPPTAWEARDRMKRNYRVMARFVELTRALPFRLLHLVPTAKEDTRLQRKMLSSLARHLAGVKPRGVVGAMRGASLSDLPSREALKKLRMPALILAWSDDKIHPLAVAESLHEILPNSQLEVMQHEDDLHRWSQLVAEFITSLK
jgi:pimeloyl-ACP methyl ester carboxylesterase